MKSTKKSHSFLSTELLVPGANMIDPARLNLFNNHLVQSVVLAETEPPRVFTNFENQVGKVSSAYKLAKNDLIVSDVIRKNEFISSYILIDKTDKEVFIFKRTEASNITESYGYKNINPIDKYSKGQVIEAGEPLFYNTAYDEELNFGFGVNLNTIFSTRDNKTYEDAIVVSETAAEKLKSHNVHTVDISLNSNDMLMNLYGDNEVFQSFPLIGENIRNGVLCARRRLRHVSSLAEFSNDAMSDINYNTDTVFYCEGKVIDIEIYSNQTIEEISKHIVFQNEANVLNEQQEYSEKIIDAYNLLKVKYTGYKFSDDFNFEYERSKLFLDTDRNWKIDGKEFDYLYYRFTILEENSLQRGNKITNRFGNKGVISRIVPDDDMPKTSTGKPVEVILNSLGVVNRTNPAQLIEQELNFIAENIVDKIKLLYETDMVQCENLFFTFFKIANPEQYKILEEAYTSIELSERYLFWEEVINEGMYIHQSPFYDNIGFERLSALHKEFELDPYEITNIETPMVMGKMYFMRLTFSLL